MTAGSVRRACARQVDSDRLTVAFRPSLPDHARRLMDTLGVDVVEDECECAPERCECDGCRAFRRFGNQSMSFDRVRQLVVDGVCPRHDVPQPCEACAEDGIEP